MTTFIKKVVMSMGIFLGTTLTPALSATIVNGGVIHFHGMIVEDPCEISPQKQHFSLSCPHEGKIRTTQISYEEALRGQNQHPDVALVSMRYINPEKSLAIVQIDYR